MKENILEKTLYYKGELESPFKEGKSNMYWNYEKGFVLSSSEATKETFESFMWNLIKNKLSEYYMSEFKAFKEYFEGPKDFDYK